MDPYIHTLAEVKAQLGLTDATDDAALTVWLNGLEGRFDVHCRRRFLVGSETEYFDGDHWQLPLHRFPVASITSVHVDDERVYGADTLLGSGEYVLNARQGLLSYGSGTTRWPAGLQAIKVVYTGGVLNTSGQAGTNVDPYEAQALKSAFMLQAIFEWRNRRVLGNAQVSQQGASLSLAPAELLPEVKTILGPLRRLV